MIEVTSITLKLDAHPQLAWDLLQMLRSENFVGVWSQSTFSYSLVEDASGSVVCWGRYKAGSRHVGLRARIEEIEGGGWLWCTYGPGFDEGGEEGSALSLGKAKDAADAALLRIGARFVDDEKQR